ncbi:MAG: hypothetical protein V3W04_02295 [Gammaproteobacteria bacterium]
MIDSLLFGIIAWLVFRAFFNAKEAAPQNAEELAQQNQAQPVEPWFSNDPLSYNSLHNIGLDGATYHHLYDLFDDE